MLLPATPCAQKILIYDEERGIIQVDKDDTPSPRQTEKTRAPAPREERAAGEAVKASAPAHKTGKKITAAAGPADIHTQRKKDPPDLYFKSGLEYYKNGDYDNALKNFVYASEQDIKPEYLLWIGKTYRQFDNKEEMFAVMERILKNFPHSDVADDALFEMAFYYQKNDSYQLAVEKYRQLAEQYPFGVSFSNREEFIDVARKQIQMMRGEMITTLKLLGFTGDDLADAYAQFQKTHHLEVTGKGDVVTVKAIKAAYAAKLREEDRLAASLHQLKQSARWAALIGAVLAINLSALFVVRARIAGNRTHLASLKESLSNLR